MVKHCLEFISKNVLYFIFSNAFLYKIKVDTIRQLLQDLVEQHYVDVKAIVAHVEDTIEDKFYEGFELECIAKDDEEDFDDDSIDIGGGSGSVAIQDSSSVTIQSGGSISVHESSSVTIQGSASLTVQSGSSLDDIPDLAEQSVNLGLTEVEVWHWATLGDQW